jgi:hypothetical protein
VCHAFGLRRASHGRAIDDSGASSASPEANIPRLEHLEGGDRHIRQVLQRSHRDDWGAQLGSAQHFVREA